MIFDESYLPLLHDLPFFSLFSDEELLKIVQEGKWLRIPVGHMVISEGAYEEEFYLLVRGKLRVFKNKKTLAMLKAGDVFGEMGALLHEFRCANVIALEECYLFEYNEHDLMRLPKTILYPFMKYIFSITAARLKELNKKYVLL
ncbi:cyclic nucleotide-binding domain-containing protein [Desulfoplanes sp. PS50]|jgi:CRP-like cAMP-binding protein